MRQSFLAGLLLSVAATSYGGGAQAPHNGSRERNDDPVLALYDSNGTRVGPIVSYGYQDGVVLTIGHTPVFVPVVRAQVTGPPNDITQQNIEYSASQLVWMSAPGVYFDASNCAGVPTYFRVAATTTALASADWRLHDQTDRRPSPNH